HLGRPAQQRVIDGAAVVGVPVGGAAGRRQQQPAREGAPPPGLPAPPRPALSARPAHLDPPSAAARQRLSLVHSPWSLVVELWTKDQGLWTNTISRYPTPKEHAMAASQRTPNVA